MTKKGQIFMKNTFKNKDRKKGGTKLQAVSLLVNYFGNLPFCSNCFIGDGNFHLAFTPT